MIEKLKIKDSWCIDGVKMVVLDSNFQVMNVTGWLGDSPGCKAWWYQGIYCGIDSRTIVDTYIHPQVARTNEDVIRILSPILETLTDEEKQQLFVELELA